MAHRSLAPSSIALPEGGASRFVSTADDYMPEGLDLNRHLVSQPASTFFLRVEGTAMESEGVENGDLLIVDRAKRPTDRKLIVIALNSELLIRRLRVTDGQASIAADGEFVVLQDDVNYEIWGTVTQIIRAV